MMAAGPQLQVVIIGSSAVVFHVSRGVLKHPRLDDTLLKAVEAIDLTCTRLCHVFKRLNGLARFRQVERVETLRWAVSRPLDV